MESFRWTLRVSGAARGRATVFVRRHQFQVGEPVHFDEQYHRITALEYALGAIGADIVSGLKSLARKRGIEIDQVEAVVHGELNNPLTYVGVVGEGGHPGLERVGVKVYVSSLAPLADVERVWQETLEKSPLVRTFQPLMSLELSLKVEQ